MSLVRPPTSCVVTYNNLRCILCLPHCEGTNNLSCSSNESNNFSFLIACHCTCHQSPFYWHVDSSVKQSLMIVCCTSNTGQEYLNPKGENPVFWYFTYHYCAVLITVGHGNSDIGCTGQIHNI